MSFKQLTNLHLVGGEVLIGGNVSDDSDDENEREWLFSLQLFTQENL